MSRHGIPIGRIFGISIDLDYLWFPIVGLAAWTLAESCFPADFPGWTRGEYWLIGIAAAILLSANVLTHELGYSVVARGCGLSVARVAPFLFGGVSHIGKEAPTIGTGFWISMAGPIASLIRAAFSREFESFVSPIQPLFAVAKCLAIINIARADRRQQFGLRAGVSGVVVTSVEFGSRRVRNLEKRVIQKVNRKPVHSVDEYERAIAGFENQLVLLLINRKGITHYAVVQPQA